MHSQTFGPSEYLAFSIHFSVHSHCAAVSLTAGAPVPADVVSFPGPDSSPTEGWGSVGGGDGWECCVGGRGGGGEGGGAIDNGLCSRRRMEVFPAMRLIAGGCGPVGGGDGWECCVTGGGGEVGGAIDNGLRSRRRMESFPAMVLIAAVGPHASALS